MVIMEYYNGLSTILIYVDIHIGVERLKICDNVVINRTNMASTSYA